MKSSNTSVIRSALTLVRVRPVAIQIGLGLLVFVLALAWLRIPDASTLDVIGTALLGLVVLGLAGIGEAWIVLQFCGRPLTLPRLLRGALWVLLSVALWLGWCALLSHMHGDDYERAGYINSRFPHTMRNFFSFGHIVLWFGWMWTVLGWIGAGIIALFAFAATASLSPLRAMGRAVRSISYWLSLLLGSSLATVLTGSLVEWTPGHGVTVETLSLILRLSAAALADATIVTFLLAILAVCITRSDASYDAPAGTPEESQPRTVDEP